jgi:hypothetical protein
VSRLATLLGVFHALYGFAMGFSAEQSALAVSRTQHCLLYSIIDNKIADEFGRRADQTEAYH